MDIVVIDEKNGSSQLGRLQAWDEFFADIGRQDLVTYRDTPMDGKTTLARPTLVFVHRRVWPADAFDALIGELVARNECVEGWSYSARPDEVYAASFRHVRILKPLPNGSPLFGVNAKGVAARVGLSGRIRWLLEAPADRLAHPSDFDEAFEYRL